MNSFLQSLTRLLPPGECVLCLDRTTSYLCDSCMAELPLLPKERRISPVLLPPSLHKTMLVYSLFVYGWPVNKMQHRFKYSKQYHYGKGLAQTFCRHLLEDTTYAQSDHVLVPTPMHWFARLRRGMDHSRVMAQYVARATSLQLNTQLLIRCKNTPAQVGLSKRQRQKNLRGAFRADSAVQGRNILLFDDVVTTTSTMQAMATCLYKAGANDVQAIAASRAD